MSSLVLPTFVADEQLTDGNTFMSQPIIRKRKACRETRPTAATSNGTGGFVANNQFKRITESDKHPQHFQNIPRSSGLPSIQQNFNKSSSSVMKPSSGASSLHVHTGAGGRSTLSDSTVPAQSTLLPDPSLRAEQLHLPLFVLPSAADRLGLRTDTFSSTSSTYSDDDRSSSKISRRDGEDEKYLSDSNSMSLQPQTHSDDHKKRKNREAAARCRSRKHDRIRKLEDKSRELMEENDHLERTVWTLRRERDGIREAFMYHLTNDCHGEFNGNF